jgi:GT2 family glycosyltransferase
MRLEAEVDAGVHAGVDVVVVAFGAPELLAACLRSLDGELPVIVVDNSSDARVRAVSEELGARYLDPGENRGFAAGVNVGLSLGRAGADVLLLNPDATITPDAVSRLRRCLHRQPDVACAAPAQVEPGGGGSARVSWPFPTPAGAWLEAVGLGRLRRGHQFMIGSVLLLRARALAEVGGFDEGFFLYAEETDWQRRADRLGWRMALCSEVTATHVGAGTGGDASARDIHFHASHERYMRKHHGTVGWWVYRTGVMAGAVPRALVLPGARGRAAADRFHLYRQGPSRVESRQ